MSTSRFDELAAWIPNMALQELLTLEFTIKVAIQMKRQGTLSIDQNELSPRNEDEGPGLHDEARLILEETDLHDLTLADQALLSALVLSDAYQQDTFSSRAINDLIVECGRPRIAHITSAIAGLTARSYLTTHDKSLSLSKEGRAKARGLIGMLKRRAAAA